MSWYVVFVQTGFEEEVIYFLDKVESHLFSNIEFDLLVPKRKIYERKQGVKAEVIRSMFPGYILVRTDNITEFYYRVKVVPHIIKFLKTDDYFVRLKYEEIEHILQMADEKGLINISQALMIDNQLKITDGPLLGREEIVQKVDKRKGRAKVEFVINGRPLLIDLGININR